MGRLTRRCNILISSEAICRYYVIDKYRNKHGVKETCKRFELSSSRVYQMSRLYNNHLENMNDDDFIKRRDMYNFLNENGRVYNILTSKECESVDDIYNLIQFRINSILPTTNNLGINTFTFILDRFIENKMYDFTNNKIIEIINLFKCTDRVKENTISKYGKIWR